jgi:glucose-1-phosphate thymidylyltransferase
MVPGITGTRPKVASHYLLESLSYAGIRKGYVIIRQGKWDIPSYWGRGDLVEMDLAYMVIEGSLGPPDTIDCANSFIRDKIVAFGFPDIIFRPKNVFSKLLAKLDLSNCDVVLALTLAHDIKAMDMVDIDPQYRVCNIQLKPRKTRLRYAWFCAVWAPTFTEFLHQFLRKIKKMGGAGLVPNRRIDSQGDIPVGAVLRAAVRAKLKVEGVIFPTSRYVDIGTPDSLHAAYKNCLLRQSYAE